MKQFFYFSRTLLTLVLVWGLSGTLLAQRVQVSGRVTDRETNESLIGVTVVEKTTTNGTTTDLDGNFKLTVNKGAILVFSYIGYESQEITAKEKMSIQLSSKQTLLNQVVVVGYGTQNKREVTGSIYKVKGADLTALPVPSFEAGLQGKAPGVQVTQSSGLAGAGSSIKIRGVGSITSGGVPLYVIDGVIIPENQGDRIGAVNTNPLNTINPEDIESIDILKDASATAIYGSRGANGVIIITTKRAKLTEGGTVAKPQFSIGYRATAASPTQLYNLLNTEEYVKLYVEAFENDKRFGVANGAATMPNEPNVPKLFGGFDPRVVAAAGYPNTDWQKQMIRVGFGHAFDASMTYGNKRLASFFSLGYHNDASYLKDNSFDLFTSRLNLDYTVTDQLMIGLNASFAHSVNNLVPVSWNGGLGKAMSTALPYWPIHDTASPNGYFLFPSSSNGSYNPVEELGNRVMRERYNRTTSNAYVKYKFTSNLNLQVDGGIDIYNRQYDEFFNNVLENNPRATQTSRTPMTLMGKAILNYDLKVKKDHKFKFMAGSEFLSNTIEKDFTKNVTFPVGTAGDPFYKNPTISDSLMNSQNYSNKPGLTGLQYGFVSMFGRVLYTFKDKYFLNVTVRRDASSRFGANYKWGNFPAASVGWIVSEEDFLKGSKWLNFLKIKAGYGKTGNAEIPDAIQWSRIFPDTKTYGNIPIRYLTQLPDPDLRWETTNAWDAGIEFGIFKDRINGAIDVYEKQTKDLFLSASTQTSSGFATILGNVGKLWNKGIELSLNTNNIKSKSFTWSTNFNVAYNRGEVTDIGGAGPDAFASTGDVRVLVGYPIGVNYLVKELGVDPATGAPIYEGIEKDEKGNIIRRFQTFTYSTDYRQPLGKPQPDWIGGFNNSFSYKRFDAAVNFIFQIGGNIYDDSEKYQLNALGNWNLRKDVLNRWQQPGDITDVPRMTLDANVANGNTSRYLHDASFTRLKSISIGYTLPSNYFKGITKIRLAITGTNLFTWTKYKGMDPEIFRDMANQQEQNLSANVTYITPPQARTFSFSLNLDF